MADHATSIEIDAEPAVVFEYLVRPEAMRAWMGQHAVLEPRPGGVFAVDIAGSPIRGTYLEVVAPRRVVVSWGVAGNDEFPPGTSTVAFTLTPTAQGTRVDVVHSDLPEADVAGHADGWSHFLPRLLVVATGGNAGDDDWVPGGTTAIDVANHQGTDAKESL